MIYYLKIAIRFFIGTCLCFVAAWFVAMQVMVSLSLLVQVLDAICLVLYIFRLFPDYLNASVLKGSSIVMLFACA